MCILHSCQKRKKERKRPIFEVLWITFGGKFLGFTPYDYVLSEIWGLGPNFNSWAIWTWLELPQRSRCFPVSVKAQLSGPRITLNLELKSPMLGNWASSSWGRRLTGIRGQPQLHSENLFQKKKKHNKRTISRPEGVQLAYSGQDPGLDPQHL